MQAAASWVKQYFDLHSKPVQTVLATLTQQSAVAMPGEIPDLSQSLEAVRTLKAGAASARRSVPAARATR